MKQEAGSKKLEHRRNPPPSTSLRGSYQIHLHQHPSHKRLKDLAYEPSGVYSAKSGYNLARSLATDARSDAFNWKRDLWNLQSPPKLHTFLWKLSNKALHVGDNMVIRGIVHDPRCKRCNQPEDELHIVLHCPFATHVWDRFIYKTPLAKDNITSIPGLLEASRTLLLTPPMGIHVPSPPWIMWNLWKARNTLVFEDRRFTEEEVFLKTLTDAREWQEAQLITPPLALRSKPPSKPPSTNIIHCFVDAAWIASTLQCGLGWCLKHPKGDIISQGSSTLDYVSSALMAEGRGIQKALLAALHAGIRSIALLSDSQSLINLLVTGGTTKELKTLLVDIRYLLEAFTSISLHYVPRVDNMCADSLAKAALAARLVS